MSKSAPQNLKNHLRWDPPYHLILGLVLLANIVYAVVHLWRQTNISSAWYLVLSFIVFIPFFKLRMYSLKVQDRVIRLEERLRRDVGARSGTGAIERRKQIADGLDRDLLEIGVATELAKQALEHNLNRKQIKERIKDWRADHWRV